MDKHDLTDPIYKKEMQIAMSRCDFSGRLGVAETVGLFMDMAAEITEMLGIGFTAMDELNFFWLTVRTRCRIHRRAKVNSLVEAATWAHAMQRSVCNRYYTLTQDGELIAEGKTEWMVFDTLTGAVSAKLAPVFYTFPASDEKVCLGARSRINRSFLPEEKLGVYTVRPTDIDIGHHMNNVAYIRAIMSLIPTAEQAKTDIREFEISYHSSALEGEQLELYRRETEDGFEVAMFKPDGVMASCTKFWAEREKG